MGDDELRIRGIAYGIWEQEGYPFDQAERHWDMAQKLVKAENEKRAIDALQEGVTTNSGRGQKGQSDTDS